MPHRFKAWVALFLVLIVCLVLVLPQVDLDDGVLKDGQSQLALLMLSTLACALVFFFPPDSLRRPRTFSADLASPGTGFADEISILRC
jgi:hypothetical protein